MIELTESLRPGDRVVAQANTFVAVGIVREVHRRRPGTLVDRSVLVEFAEPVGGLPAGCMWFDRDEVEHA